MKAEKRNSDVRRSSRASVAERSRAGGRLSLRSVLVIGLGLIGTSACRDAPNAVATAPVPRAPLRSQDVSVDTLRAESWNSYSAVVTIQRGETSRFGRIGARDMKLRIARSLRPDGSWGMIIRPVPDFAAGGAAAPASLGFSRIELTDTAMRIFDALGRELTRPTSDIRKGTDFTDRARRARARRPTMLPEIPGAPFAGSTVGMSRTPSGSAGLDMLVAGPQAGRRAKARLARAFIDPPEQRGEAFRYARSLDDRALELTVDSLTGVPLEVKELRGGELELRVVHTYDLIQGGIKVLRETRVERSASAPGGYGVFVTRYDSVSVGQNAEGVQ